MDPDPVEDVEGRHPISDRAVVRVHIGFADEVAGQPTISSLVVCVVTEQDGGMPSWLAAPLIWLATAALFGWSLWGQWRDLSLRLNGARSDGEVTSVRAGTRPKGGANYTPVVRFTTTDGDNVFAEPPIHRSWQGRFKAGRQVLVYYDPANPKRIRVKGHAYLVPGVFVMASGVFLAGPTIVIINHVFY
ncbi:DUF3592 domain-containing protein [Streptomyces sp. NPDC057644]|uniref:DUF3592 domain-containing protein n=1 Tax=Streptomyces sp. NPDC057644 TaxID=3346191 RepID=UPI0036B88488